MAVYFYKGDMLSKYCKDKGYKYKTIMNRIYGKGITVEEAIKTYEDYDAKGKKCPNSVMYKLPNGRGLRQFCLEKGIIYELVIKNIYKGKNIEEAIQETIEKKGKKYLNHSCYFYKGQLLRHYFNGEEKKYRHTVELIRKKHISVEDAVKQIEGKENEI